MTEDELFARRPLGMRMAMIVRQWRATIDHALADTGLTQSGWTVLMQLSQLGDNVSSVSWRKCRALNCRR
jgi:MarR family transcriptional regulator for hemolysin